nr:putative integron gene cassette protein [uncultured bacterium]
MSVEDPYNLQRFVTAQAQDYESALAELRAGRKEPHWIWYIFPQVAGLGFSSMAERYAIQSKSEALAYLEHDVLGARLIECSATLLRLDRRRIEDIMGSPDDMKLRSSMTLFKAVSSSDSIFEEVLDKFYSGYEDARTIEFPS